MSSEEEAPQVVDFHHDVTGDVTADPCVYNHGGGGTRRQELLSQFLMRICSLYTSSCAPYLPELDYQDVNVVMLDECPPSCSPPPSPPLPPPAVPVESALYYYGHVSRETAEWLLWDRGCKDGMYLLRDSNSDYVLSLCYQKSVLHYRVKKLPSGEVSLCGVPQQRFPGPVELVEGVEGLACHPSIPCNKSLESILPLTHWGLTHDDIRQAVLKKGQEWGLHETSLEQRMAEEGSDVRLLMVKTLHEIQPWFHGLLSRQQAEKSILESGLKDGKFLVRERDDSSYALCVSHLGHIKHYKIDVLPSGEFAIQDGQRFPSIMALVSHYSLFSDGLWCSLTEACLKRVASDSPSIRPSPIRIPDTPNMAPETPDRQRNKVLNGGIHSPQARASPKLIVPSGNQKGLFTKLVTPVTPPSVSVQPEANGDLIDFSSSPPLSSVTPPHSRKQSGSSRGSQEELRSRNKMQKASSFDLIPAFFSALFSSSSNEDGKSKRKIWEGRKMSGENGVNSEFFVNLTPSDDVSRSPKTPHHEPTALRYANKEVFNCPVNRSASLGEPSQLEQPNSVASLESNCSSPSSATFSRSASSPSVVSQLNKPPLPPRPLHFMQSTSCGEGVRSQLIEEQEPKDTPPAPPPRKKGHQRVKDLTSTDPLSPDSNTSPTLTEESEESDRGSPIRDAMYTELDEELALLAMPVEDGVFSEDLHQSLECNGLDLPLSTNGLELSKSFSQDRMESIYATLAGDTSVLGICPNNVEELTPPNSPAKMQSTISREESDLAYQTLRRFRRGPVHLDPKGIALKEQIGSGNFGEVWCGRFSSGTMEVSFAVKMLKEAVAHQRHEILKEAQTMAALDHPHIVRLIGVCDGDPFMLVMELAPVGPLNKHLRNNNCLISLQSVLHLMLQVSNAMEYLENQQYVHRDLAARNVLLVNESFAKISDFGMSRAIGLGKEYYRAETAGKWPLKWYAPECIYYFKFSHKSDVWSFGVTLWEAMAYGQKPYQGMAGREILQMFEKNKRLAKPDGCPEDVYQLMWSCWQYKPENRPNFSQVHHLLKQCLVTTK